MDTEDISRKIDLSVADNFFSKNESDFLNKSPEADRQNLFFDLWTLKEAYIKAKGLGLSIGLDTFSFFLDGDAIDVRFDDSLCDASDQWRFFKFYPVDSYVASIALQTDSKSPCKLHIYKCIPFVSIEKIVCKGGIAVSL
jgi:4'-phosphopantetheinyl transferase